MNGAWIPCYLALVIGLGIGFWLHSLLDEKPVQAPPLPDTPLAMPGFPGAGYDADLRDESGESSKAQELWERQIDDILSGKSRWHDDERSIG